MTYEQILDRDVPTIKEHMQSFARQGIIAPINIYYRHQGIAGQSIACDYDLAKDGWTLTEITIPVNLPYSAYYNFLYQRLGNVPLFA